MIGPRRVPVGRLSRVAVSIGLGIAVALGAAAALLADFFALGTPVVLAATPSPSPPAGDPRSPGQGPGFVGEPLLAIGVVLLVALLAVLITVAYLRLNPVDQGRRR